MAAVVAACGQSNGTAGAHSPSPARVSPSARASPSAQATPSKTPQPVTGAYGVLYSSQASSSYTVSIVGVDGKVVASADANTPAEVSCANAGAATVSPPLSMSNSRVYFMDSQGSVFTLAPDGTKSQGPVINLPAPTASRRSMFAVSPDDAMMAVVVDDFSASGATTRLYMDQLQLGGSQNLLYSETGASTLLPVGWHGTNNLVLAKFPSCITAPGPFSNAPIELHVVDPATANRRFTLGGPSTCTPVGAPSPAGVVCWSNGQSKVLNWTAGTVRSFPVQGPELQLLSPNGSDVALVDNTATTIQSSGKSMAGMFACTWLDDTHVMSGGDPQHQPRLADVTTGIMVPVASQGDCAGRLPGGL